MRTCPVCGENAVITCRCMIGDSECKNGHNWYYCPVHRKPIMGVSDHSKGTNECRCQEELTKKTARIRVENKT